MKSVMTLGIELGSTRIKAVLVDGDCRVLAGGESVWENRFENGFWTYGLEEVWSGLQCCYKKLKTDFKNKFGVTLTKVNAIGISGMMHGYLVLDKKGELLTPFRTWRNNNAEEAAKELTALFNYPVPARWSVAHLWQAVKTNEPHIRDIAFQTTLAGYVHYKLTGEKVIGIGEASGMFPIDLKTKSYNRSTAKSFDGKIKDKALPFGILDIMPKVLVAGESAGYLTAEGAALIDPEGDLECGIPFCPPEGDAGTGMVATNSVSKGTGNISAGTSVFGMVVLEKDLKKVHPEIDLVTTPDGSLVAMAHCNNCTSEINAWADLFGEVIALGGEKADKGWLYEKLFLKALEGENGCGGLLGYNYVSGENITQIDEGRPMFVRTTKSRFNLSNFMRMQIYSAFATLKIGLDILTKEEGVKIGSVLAHGGIFKTKGVAQRFLAAAMNTPVTVNQTSNEGGPFGIAVLAGYLINGGGKSLSGYLAENVFKNDTTDTAAPVLSDVEGFNEFMKDYIKGLSIVKTAVTALKE